MLPSSTPTALLVATTVSSLSAAPSCTTATPDQNGYVPPEACNANYGFYPKWQDNMAFAVVFGLITITHLGQAIGFKKPFCWIITMGALWECICFVLRTLGAKDQQNSDYVTMSTLFFLLAPLWINAFVYMVVARLVYFLDERHRVLRIPATRLAKYFVATDIVCFFIQAVGGGLMAGGQDNSTNANLGKNIYMAGCGVQLACVVIFTGVVAVFYRTVAHKPRTQNRWIKPLLWTVFLVLILIVERIIFRLIEFSRGASNSNSLLRHEWYQLYLDALPMAIALTALNVVHPALVLHGPGSDLPPTRLLWWRKRKIKFNGIPLGSMEALNHANV